MQSRRFIQCDVFTPTPTLGSRPARRRLAPPGTSRGQNDLTVAVREMRVSYQVVDPVVLFLPETQAREALFTEVAEGQIRSSRVSVIPQAEGRSYLGVLVEIDTEEGLLTRAASIPIPGARRGGGSAARAAGRSAPRS